MSTTEELLQQIERMLDDMDRSARPEPSRSDASRPDDERAGVLELPEAPAGPEVTLPHAARTAPPEAPAPLVPSTPPVTPSRGPDPADRPVTESEVVVQPDLEPDPEAEPELDPELEPAIDPGVRGRRRRRRVWRAILRELRFLAILALAFALGSAGTLAYRWLERSEAPAPPPGAAAAPPEQRVSSWVVWPHAERDVAFATILASGGERDPLALVIPPYLAVNIPGQGLGTVDEAAESRDPELMATTVGNVLQVPVDDALVTDGSQLAAMVDAVGGVESAGGRLDGAGAVAYLSAKGIEPSDRSIRWQEVLSGVLDGLDRTPAALADIPEPPRAALGALIGPDRSVLELPVREIGAGLADTDDAELERLVRERFLRPGATLDDVRLLVLNGNGRPGIGADVARLLVPIGFRLVSSQNASRFDQKETLIVAANLKFLDEAELARRALGVGEVVLGEQPTRVTDVSVIVGRDFRRR